MAFVFEVTSVLHRSMEGMKPSSERVCNGTGLMPNNVKSILHPVSIIGNAEKRTPH
jgi:hypothetical protein